MFPVMKVESSPTISCVKMLEAAEGDIDSLVFKITGLTWIVERSFAWLGRNRRFSKDYEYRVRTSEALLDIAAARLILNRLAPA
jgi:putative transposase